MFSRAKFSFPFGIIPTRFSERQKMTTQFFAEVNDQEEVQSLSDFHVDYIRRWMEDELLRQQVSSDRLVKERANAKRLDSSEAESMARLLREAAGGY
jgi:hypothetical protein